MKKLLILTIIISSLLLYTNNTQARSFNANFLISDFEFTNNNSMDAQDIKTFIHQFNTPLRLYMEKLDDTEERQWSWEIIKKYADEYKINPQVLLTTLQKEQSLLLGSDYKLAYRLNWSMGYGICDSCSPYDPRLQKYKGFANQIKEAARRLQQCLNEPEAFHIQQKQAYNIDGQQVTPANQATACLYSYTPHLNGNKNFVTIWDRWFDKNYPDNTLISSKNDDKIYKLENNVKRLIKNPSLLSNYTTKYPLIQLDEWEIKQYPNGINIEYPPYSLLGVPQNGIYLLTDNQKIRKIVSAKVFKKLGFNINEIEKISSSELKMYQQDNEITENDIFPLGQIAKNTVSNEIYYIYQNKRYPILDTQLIPQHLGKYNFKLMTPDELNEYEIGKNLLYPDGTLLKEKESPYVYLINDGKKQHIANEYTFKKMNYRWNNIKETTSTILQNYENGETIDYKSIDEDIKHLQLNEFND